MMKAIAYSRQIRQAIEQRRNEEQQASRANLQPLRNENPPKDAPKQRSH
jgi:hypothetical protein